MMSMSTEERPQGSPGEWCPAALKGDLNPHRLNPVTVGGHKLIVLQVDGEVRAYRDACPHEGFSLSQHGEQQDFIVVCNKHLWEFDADTGEYLGRIPRPECALKRYPTRVIAGRVEVDLSAHPMPQA